MHTLTIDVPGPLWVTSNDRYSAESRGKVLECERPRGARQCSTRGLTRSLDATKEGLRCSLPIS